MADENALLARALPHSHEAEQSLIGAMLAEKEAIDNAVNLISSEDFYDRQLGLVFDAIVALDNERKPVDDPVLLQEKLREKNAPPQIADQSYLASLVAVTPDIDHGEEYAKLIAKKATLRRLIHTAQEIEKDCYTGGENFEAILDDAERKMFAITQRKATGDYIPIRKIIADTLARMEAAGRVHGNITGVATGFQDLDYYTSGFQPSDLILIAARPSMGKTALALNIAQNMIVNGHQPVALFSLEMSNTQLTSRLLSMHSHVDSHKMRTGELNEREWADIVESADVLGGTELIIDDTPSISVADMRSRCRRYKAEKNISAIFIDYLQLMTATGSKAGESRQQEISEISRGLKALARELNVPVIALSQLSRAVESRTDKKPLLSDLRA